MYIWIVRIFNSDQSIRALLDIDLCRCIRNLLLCVQSLSELEGSVEHRGGIEHQAVDTRLPFPTNQHVTAETESAIPTQTIMPPYRAKEAKYDVYKCHIFDEVLRWTESRTSVVRALASGRSPAPEPKAGEFLAEWSTDPFCRSLESTARTQVLTIHTATIDYFLLLPQLIRHCEKSCIDFGRHTLCMPNNICNQLYSWLNAASMTLDEASSIGHTWKEKFTNWGTSAMNARGT